MTVAPEPARPEEWPAAFRLLFRPLPAEVREQRVSTALALLEQGELMPDGILVLRDGGEVAGVLACMPLPGATALVWPPQWRDGPEDVSGEDRLVRHAVRWLRGRGVKLVQSLFPPDGVAASASLERNGFVHVTHLWYLRHTLGSLPPDAGVPGRLDFVTVEDAPEQLAETLIRSYEGTLDCPEISGVRTVEEVLDGHRSQGRHDPRRWWLATDAGQAVGVALVSLTPETDEWDVMYVGVVPEARRRGFGRELMLKVLVEAAAAGVPGVTLSVDGRNDPAWHLYRALGFEPFDRREVFLAILR